MNNNSKKTLRRIEQNDDELTLLCIGESVDGGFISSDAGDYSRLGAAIGNNNHLTNLRVCLGANHNQSLDISNTEFFNCLKRNSSINDLTLHCRNQTLIGGVGHEILMSYQKINNNLTRLCINEAVLDNGGGNAITETLRWCRNLKFINLAYNSITDEQLLPMIDAIKGGCNTSLERLYLYENRIGNAGCHAIATLLADTNCNLQLLNLNTNQIGNEGATVIADSLVNNTKLQTLYLRSNPFDQSAIDIFCTVLCNSSSVNDTYRSNHTLEELALSNEQQGQHTDHLASLLNLNTHTNKSHVAIKKILTYHPNIDMGPLFEWDAEGEQTLKALPFVIYWFERAGLAVADGCGSDNDEDSSNSDNDDDDDDEDEEEEDDYQIEQKKLSAIFQFAKAMPVWFVPTSNIKEKSKKRKRGLV